ncbi:MAG: hypothetical protein ACRD0F_06395 [Acidimicrobiales bacterium]
MSDTMTLNAKAPAAAGKGRKTLLLVLLAGLLLVALVLFVPKLMGGDDSSPSTPATPTASTPSRGTTASTPSTTPTTARPAVVRTRSPFDPPR